MSDGRLNGSRRRPGLAAVALLAAFGVIAVGFSYPRIDGGRADPPATQTGEAAGRLAISMLYTGSTSGITLIDPNGGHPSHLTEHPGWQDDLPSVSPGRGRIAFTRTKDQYRSFQIYVMGSDGTHVRRITSGRIDEHPSWSPSGGRIVYADALLGVLRTVRPDGGGARRIPNIRAAGDPDWAPNGRRIAYTQNGRIWHSRLDGTQRRRLARGSDPDWAPNGRRIVFTGPSGGIRTVGVNGGAVRKIGGGLLPDWSPDGRHIALTRWPPSLEFAVWVMKPDGSDLRLVVRNARSPDWLP